MITRVIIPLLLILWGSPIFAGLLINEVACATPGDDWVELFYYSENREKLDVSRLYVTMYYGANESLSSDPIHIYSYDREETPYDDRFLIIHLTETEKPDETDLTGDANRNGYIDIYCNNFVTSLWNTDCIVAIDTDDNSSNGGIIDFMAYSSRDGSINDNIQSYVGDAQILGHWQDYSGNNEQECMINIGRDGLESYESISRAGPSDSNSQKDFAVTKYQTPGRQNILAGNFIGRGKIFTAPKKRISIIPGHLTLGTGNIEIFIHEPCNIRFRIFSSIGMLIFESPLYRDIYPGNFTLNWNLRGLKRNARTGLYIGYIDATSRALKKSETEHIFIILNNYK